MASKMKTEFVLNFSNILADEGDMFFTSGSVEKDYQSIVGTIKSQGYWSGVELRYFFDEDLNFIRTEERRFG